MKEYTCEKIRNVAVVGHSHVGKTSLVESLLFSAGQITRMGTPASGNTVSDYDPEEVKRQISIHSKIIPVEWNDFKFNLVDTPGYADFYGETISALKIVDSAIVVFDAIDGAGAGTAKIIKQAELNNLPLIAVVNKIDKERSDFSAVVEKIRDKFGKKFIPLNMPGSSGIVDLLTTRESSAQAYKEMLIEAIAEVDDKLLEKYLDSQELSSAELASALKAGVMAGKIVPIMACSATAGTGIPLLFTAIADLFPDPGSQKANDPFAAYVFKTVNEPHVGELTYVRVYSGKLTHSSNVHNSTRGHDERVGQIVITRGKQRFEVQTLNAGDMAALPKLKNTRTGDTLCNDKQHILFQALEYPESSVSLGVKPKSKADQEKMGIGLSSFMKEDPTFKMHYDPQTREVVVSGMGDIHLEIILSKLKERYGIEIETTQPRIPYKETIKAKAKAQGKYKKQTGGHGQYGDAWIEIEPLPHGAGFEFVDKIVGGAIPRNYIPSVEKGIREAMEGGVIAGYPVADIRATLTDGSYHEVDSSDLAFKIAASMGFKKAFMEARPVLLEPIVHIEVAVPPSNVGDVVSDLNKRRGRIISIEEEKVIAEVPQAEIARYAADLRSFTHGAGTFTTKFSRYEEVLPQTQEKLCQLHQKEKEAGSGAAR